MSLEREPDSTEVRSITVDTVAQEGQRPARLVFSNRGVEAGRIALEAFAGQAQEGEQQAPSRAVMLVPEFKSLGGRPTDWNDLATTEGLPGVAKQVMAALGVPQQREVRHIARESAHTMERTAGGMAR